MVTRTNEQALEACIEKVLTGTCREELKPKERVSVAWMATVKYPWMGLTSLGMGITSLSAE